MKKTNKFSTAKRTRRKKNRGGKEVEGERERVKERERERWEGTISDSSSR
jgi:hypothetical protein